MTIMKKILFTIISLATLVGCSKVDTAEIAPRKPLYTTSFEVNAGADASRAIYNDLAFAWEEGDVLYAIQGAEGSVANAMTLDMAGANGAASFRTDDFKYASLGEHKFHFVYSANNVTLSHNGAEVAVSAEQDGVWRPVLAGSTATPIVAGAASWVALSQQTAALAVRVYSNNKSDALQVKTITVKAEKPLLGSLVGSLDESGKMVYTPNATIDTFTADVSGIALNDKGQYEYLFEVLPVNAGKVTITLTDMAGETLTLTTAGDKVFEANVRTAINVAWNPTVTLGGATSWYEDTLAGKSSSLNAGEVQLLGVSANGAKATHIGWKVNEADEWSLLEITDKANMKLTGVASGTYHICAAVQAPNGEWNYSEENYQVTVTAKPTVTYKARSTYAYNDGTLVKENVVANNKSIIFESYAIASSDEFTNSLLDTANVKFVYGSSEAAVSGAATVNNALAVGEYSCYVAVPFKANGARSLQSAKQAIYVTGIPYEFNFYGSSTSAVDAAGWTRNGDTDYQSSLLWLSKNAVGSSYGWIATPAMYAPAGGISTAVTVVTKFYEAAIRPSKTMTIYVGATSSPTTTASSTVSGSASSANSTSSTKDLRTMNANVTVPQGKQYISINHNNTKGTASYFYISSYKCLYN